MARWRWLERPGQIEALLAHPDVAVEELIRFTSPVRLAGGSLLLANRWAGLEVAAGSQVFVHIDEANRDVRRWPDGDSLDLTRRGPGI